MPVDAELMELMTDKVGWKVKTGQDVYRNPTYAAEVTLEGAYLLWDERETKDSNGEKRVSTVTVYLSDVYAIDTNDRLSHDGQDLGETIRVIAYNDEAGPYGMEIHCG